MPVRGPLASNRRYALGVVLVALLGIAMLVVYVVWSSAAISGAIEHSFEVIARDVAASYRDKLARALGAGDATSPQVWARLDPLLEETFEILPNLVGIVIRLQDGSIGAVIGPTELRKAPFLPAPPARNEIEVRVESENDHPKATASFVFGTREDGKDAVQANVHLRFTSLTGLRSSILRQFQIGTILVVILIYLLAVLAYFIGRQGTRAENREREKAVRLRAIGDVAGAIAHELRNPLNAISLSFQVIGETLRRSGSVETSREKDLERARGEVAKISKVVDNFVSFARLSDMNVTEFDLADVARETLAALSAAAAGSPVRPEIQVTGPTKMRGDRDKIAQALATTVQAVFDAVKARPGSLEVDVVGARKEIDVRIRGRGERVDSRRISNFTSPRHAWDEPVGLGLTIARTWIDLHGGTVVGAAPSEDRAELSIVLPKGFE